MPTRILGHPSIVMPDWVKSFSSKQPIGFVIWGPLTLKEVPLPRVTFLAGWVGLAMKPDFMVAICSMPWNFIPKNRGYFGGELM